MDELLVLAHRLPYPPDKGDKIRSYHFLQALSREFRVHLGTFVHDSRDWSHRAAIDAICPGACLRPLPRWRGGLRCLRGLANSDPLTVAYFRDAELARWVNKLLTTRSIRAVLVLASSMAQYLDSNVGVARARGILDFCDVDSAKWRKYAAVSGIPMRGIYAREARFLQAYEARCLSRFRHCVVVSESEARILRISSPANSESVRVVRNGVDVEYFNPESETCDPLPNLPRRIVFTGRMDYYANVDAVLWFADEVLPLVRPSQPNAHFVIVGANPTSVVRRLGRRSGIHVTGWVDDVRPYLAHADVVVAPMRIAQGVQNKVLEALAMGRPLVARPESLAGLDSTPCGCIVAADADSFASAVLDVLLTGHRAAFNPQPRLFVTERFGWPTSLAALVGLLRDQRSFEKGGAADC